MSQNCHTGAPATGGTLAGVIVDFVPFKIIKLGSRGTSHYFNLPPEGTLIWRGNQAKALLWFTK